MQQEVVRTRLSWVCVQDRVHVGDQLLLQVGCDVNQEDVNQEDKSELQINIAA